MDLKTNVVDYLKTYYDTSHDIDNVLEEICKVCNIGICDNNQKISEYSEFGHYDGDAHKWFANYLYKYMTSNKLI